MIRRWYALQVHAGREKWIVSYLEHRGLEHLLLCRSEVRRWSDRLTTIRKPIFSGYVFCHLGEGEHVRALSVPGVLRIVGYGRLPVPVADEEIAALQILSRGELPLEEWPYLQEGDQVRLEGGALDGLLGRFVQARGGGRVVVSVTILQRSVAVEIDRSRLTPAMRVLHPLVARVGVSDGVGPDRLIS